MNHTRNAMGLLSTSAMLAVMAAPTRASLVIDLRATATTAGVVLDPKTVLFTGGPGDTVTLDIVAVTTGANADPNDDGIISFQGSLLSSPGGLLGNLAAERTSQFQAFGGSNGLPQDLDGDGDLDVGSNNNGIAANFFAARAIGPSFIAGTEHLAGRLTWTHTAAATDTLLNFRPRVSGTAASWFEDGSQVTSSNFAGGAPAAIFIPEPAAPPAAAGGAAVVSLLARRRHVRWKGAPS